MLNAFSNLLYSKLFIWSLYKTPKEIKLLFTSEASAHEAKLCWQNKVHQDLKKCETSESSWYTKAQDGTKWRTIRIDGFSQHVMAPPPDKLCTTCHPYYHRKQDDCSIVPPPILDDNNETCDHRQQKGGAMGLQPT